MNGTTVVPKGTGGAWHTAADGRPQGDGRLYVDGDAPWFAPILFEANGTPTPGQDGVNNPFHAPLKLVTNPDGSGSVRFENVQPWSPGQTASGGTGYTPQAPYSPGQSDVASRYFAAKQALLAFGQALGLE